LEKLNLSCLEQLEKYLPEDKILGQYQELKENIDELDPSEKFLVIVKKQFYLIIFAFINLNCFIKW
jgi:hypothetical protein